MVFYVKKVAAQYRTLWLFMFNKKVEAQHRTQWFSMLKRWQPSIGPCDFYAKKAACDQPHSNNHNPSTITVISHVDEYGQPLKNCMQCWRAMHIYQHGIYDFSSRFSSKLEKIATPYWIRKKIHDPLLDQETNPDPPILGMGGGYDFFW